MLNFIINNREIKSDLPPGGSLVDFIRDELHLYGTKIGCREGDCGACTILVGELVEGKLKYRTMASCLTPLGNVNGKHVVTIEGVNGKDLTPIQEELIDKNATQCGFCTPGFVLSLHGFCLSDKEKNNVNVVEALAGNICRCTGYKSIEKAANVIVTKLQSMPKANNIAWLVQNKFLPDYFTTIEERLKKIVPTPLKVKDAGNIIAGGTDLLLQDPEGAIELLPNLVFDAKEFNKIKIENKRCYIGATTPITDVKDSLEIKKLFPKMDQYLNLMASTPIRNMATVGGNIANGSPIGDLSVMLLALDATLVISNKGQIRELPLKDFFLGYKKTNKTPDEFIQWIYFDLPDDKTFFSFEKISKRLHLDMATVNSSLKIVIENGVIKKASFAVGGLGPSLKFMDKTCSALIGKTLTNETFKEANRVAQTEITPRSRAEYKRSLVRQQLFIHLMSFSPMTISLEALK